MVLRPRLSTGLPFRTLFVNIMTKPYGLVPFILVMPPYKIATTLRHERGRFRKKLGNRNLDPVCISIWAAEALLGQS